jgi:bacterioferritin-associated ferredoxin
LTHVGIGLANNAGSPVYACICHAVHVADVAECIDNGAHDEEAIGAVTGAGTSCGGCLDRICEMLRASLPAVEQPVELQPVG